MLKFAIRPGTVAVVLAGIIALLAVAHLLVSVLEVYWPSMLGLHRLFNLGIEGNLPTFFSALQLLVAGLLLAAIAQSTYRKQDRQWWRWALLAVGFLVMSVDEAAQIHEGVVGKLMSRLVREGEGIWYYAWYAAYIPLLGALLVLYVPFIRNLPRRYFKLFGAAALVYVGGAVGVEMGEARLAFNQMDGMVLSLSLLVEETCEMAGVMLFVYTLLLHIGEQQLVLRLSVLPEPPAHPQMTPYATTGGDEEGSALDPAAPRRAEKAT